MEKINFVNNSTPALNATNLNKLQDNVEDSIKTETTTSDIDTYSCNYINGIIESGSNANGNYIKYKDGTLICYKDHDFGSQAFNSAWGSLYETQKLNLGDFPMEFVGNNPGVQIMARGAYFIERSYSASNTSWGQFWAVRAVNDTQGVSVSCLAIGKWK